MLLAQPMQIAGAGSKEYLGKTKMKEHATPFDCIYN
jgi:hypothetical protein